MKARFNPARSTTTEGLFSRCLSTGKKVWPPASALASMSSERILAPSARGRGLTYSKLYMPSSFFRRARHGLAMHQGPGGGDGFDDVVVAGAAAKIALQPMPDLRLGEALRMALHQIDRAHHHAGGTKAAL